MTLALLAGIPLAALTALLLRERRRQPIPMKARAARCTVENALRSRGRYR